MLCIYLCVCHSPVHKQYLAYFQRKNEHIFIINYQMPIDPKLGLCSWKSLTIMLQYFKNMVTLCLVGKAEKTCKKLDVITWEENIWNPNFTFYSVYLSNQIYMVKLTVNTFATQIFHLYVWFYFDCLGLFRFYVVNYSC